MINELATELPLSFEKVYDFIDLFFAVINFTGIFKPTVEFENF